MSELNEKCAVFGVYGPDLDVSRLTFYGLFAQQHRGQEATGICVSDGNAIHSKRGVGLVSQVYSEEDIEELKGKMAIGHNRYSTSHGEGTLAEYTQPYVCKHGRLVLAHNGNLPSTKKLEEFLHDKGIETTTHNDSKLMHLAIEYYLEQGLELEEAVTEAYPLFTGAFSLIVMTHNRMVALRDQFGIRPLSVGIIDGGFVFASETCALNTIGTKTHWEIAPGEMISCVDGELKNIQLVEPKPMIDAFEFVYFARPDSRICGQSVYQARWSSGWELGKECPIDADVIVPVPETSIPAAIGYAKKTGISLEMALVKNRYIHRTFIQPGQELRERGVELKLNVLSSVVKGKRVVLIDDSIVRGTTSKQIVEMVFRAGAKEVHFLISSPQVRYPDFYGIDTPKQENLIGASTDIEHVREHIGATSLCHLSIDGLVTAIGIPREQLCTACFTGEYPIDIGEHRDGINFNL